MAPYFTTKRQCFTTFGFLALAVFVSSHTFNILDHKDTDTLVLIGGEKNVTSPLQCAHACLLANNCNVIQHSKQDESHYRCASMIRTGKPQNPENAGNANIEENNVKQGIISTLPNGQISNDMSDNDSTQGEIFSSCTHALQESNQMSGIFNITINDGSFLLNCTMIGGTFYVAFNHDKMHRIMFYRQEPPYIAVFTYLQELNTIKIVKTVAAGCMQELKYECFESIMKDAKANWRDIDNVRYSYFPSALRSSTSNTCYCSGIEECCCDLTSNDVNCVCDQAEKKLRDDEGYFTDKNRLPLTKLTYEEVDGEGTKYGSHTLGPLLCEF